MLISTKNKLFNLKLINNLTRNLFNFNKKNKYDLGKCNVIVELGEVSDELIVPDHIVKPNYYYEYSPPGSAANGKVEHKNQQQIDAMRKSCKLAANILKKCEKYIQIGITTDEIDKFVHNDIIQSNAYPSPLRYGNFPKSICTSVNNVACHGIPDDRPLMDGDIINVDITVFFNGYHGDCSKTFLVGNVDERGKFLVKITEESLYKAISCCGPNRPFNLIGKTIQQYAKQYNLNVIPSFNGHGIGSYFHGPPEILHFENNLAGLMESGQTFTIEPILTLGNYEIEIQEDDWTGITIDNSRSAQFEHTILITDNGYEILTVPGDDDDGDDDEKLI